MIVTTTKIAAVTTTTAAQQSTPKANKNNTKFYKNQSCSAQAVRVILREDLFGVSSALKLCGFTYLVGYL